MANTCFVVVLTDKQLAHVQLAVNYVHESSDGFADGDHQVIGSKRGPHLKLHNNVVRLLESAEQISNKGMVLPLSESEAYTLHDLIKEKLLFHDGAETVAQGRLSHKVETQLLALSERIMKRF